MKFLLDTCTFLWLTIGDERLSQVAAESFVNPVNTVFLSAVSVWEIGVKHNLGKLSLPYPPRQFVPKERERHLISSLDLSESDTLHLTQLPPLHKDPFDRMLVCQAIEHSLTILTCDSLVTQYPVRTLW